MTRFGLECVRLAPGLANHESLEGAATDSLHFYEVRLYASQQMRSSRVCRRPQTVEWIGQQSLHCESGVSRDTGARPQPIGTSDERSAARDNAVSRSCRAGHWNERPPSKNIFHRFRRFRRLLKGYGLNIHVLAAVNG